jgi:hypothetical protein
MKKWRDGLTSKPPPPSRLNHHIESDLRGTAAPVVSQHNAKPLTAFSFDNSAAVRRRNLGWRSGNTLQCPQHQPGLPGLCCATGGHNRPPVSPPGTTHTPAQTIRMATPCAVPRLAPQEEQVQAAATRHLRRGGISQGPDSVACPA